MGNERKSNQIVIKNGDWIRKWISTLIPVALLFGGGIFAWANFCSDLEVLDTKIDTSIAVVSVAAIQYRIDVRDWVDVVIGKIAEIKKEGTLESRENKNRIIAVEKDIKNITKDVAYMRKKLDRNEGLLREIVRKLP